MRWTNELVGGVVKAPVGVLVQFTDKSLAAVSLVAGLVAGCLKYMEMPT